MSDSPGKSPRSEAASRFAARGALFGIFFGMYTFFIAIHDGSPGELPGPFDVFRILRLGFTRGTGALVFTIAMLTLSGALGAALWAAIGSVVGWVSQDSSSRWPV